MSITNRQLFIFWVALGLLTLGSNWSGFDLWLSHWFYSQEAGLFVYREHPVFSHLLHSGLKNMVVAFWVGLFARLIWLKAKRAKPNPAQPQFLDAPFLTWLLVTSGICAMAVATFKSQSMHACPWSLSIYGGTESYFLFWGDASGSAGKCFPSGHASIGWMWLPFAIAPATLVQLQRRANPVGYKLMELTLAIVAVLSSATQIIRGAHFLSHVMATAWVCLTITLVLKIATEYQKRLKHGDLAT